VLIIILSLFISAYGLLSDKSINEEKIFTTIHGDEITLYGKGIYHNDSVSGASQIRAQDFVTLIIGIPFLVVSLLLSNKNSLKGKLLLTGTLGYFLYTYVSYTFLITYNNYFLIYVILMSLSFFGFILNFTSKDFKEIKNHFSVKFPRKYIGILNILTGIFICFLWLDSIISSFGKAPAQLEHYTTLVIQGLDLGFIVPLAILSGFLLIRDKSFGYLLSTVIIIKGVTILLAIGMMIIFMALSGVNVPIIQIIVFPLLALLYLINLFLVLKNVSLNSRAATSQS
jgi:hypothetical protein